MINLWKVTRILLGFSISTVTYAIPMFVIVPQSTSVTVSGSADQNYVLTWTVQNNLNKATPIILADWGATGITTVAGTDECGIAPVAPGSTCTISMGIKGSVMPMNTLQISPKFCTPDHQLCSQATASHRLTVSKTSGPTSPNGTWRVFSITPSANFPEFVTINYPRLDIGVINNNYSPIVYQCPNLNSDYNCTTVDVLNFLSYNFTSMTNLVYTPSGTLYGIFTKPQDDAVNPVQSYILNIPASSTTWQQVTSLSGTTLGLDTNSSLGLLFSTGLLQSDASSIGSSALLQSNSVENSDQNTASSNLSSIVDDGLGHIYVAGLLSGDPSQIELFSKVWLWNPSNNTYTAINMPDDILLITDMVSDGKGTVYISGLDSATNGHVWRYTAASGQFIDTGLVASSVTTLFYSPYGYLLAGGIENSDYNGAVWYYTNGSWTNMNLNNSVSLGCSSIASIAADANNDVVATGYDLQNTSTIWIFN